MSGSRASPPPGASPRAHCCRWGRRGVLAEEQKGSSLRHRNILHLGFSYRGDVLEILIFWALKMCNELRSLNKANVASGHMRLYLPDSSSSLSLSLSFFSSFFSFCNVTTEGGGSEAFHCLVISFTARPHVVFFFHDWLNEDVKTRIFSPLRKKKKLLRAASIFPHSTCKQPRDYSHEILYEPQIFFQPT